MTTEIQFLSQSILSGHKTTNSGEDFLGRLLGRTHEVFFFLFLDISPRDNLN